VPIENKEMVTIAARIPIDHMRHLKTLAVEWQVRTVSDMIRAAVQEFVYNHGSGADAEE